ncbi:hypothetical protein [Actinoplanes sp. OR16]|uniref:hypothetical protein n=1 Tax=Actinoplanes sp. OR16 TaxID=946334 RepID=UPI00135F19C4|nr:hypothetical protein [Actinoplanes sp. OR16]
MNRLSMIARPALSDDRAGGLTRKAGPHHEDDERRAEQDVVAAGVPIAAERAADQR